MQGGYKIELVDPDTGAAYKEHIAPNGQVFVEVEPDAEYKIKVSVVDGDSWSKEYHFQALVDGKKLPTYKRLSHLYGPYIFGFCEWDDSKINVSNFRCVQPQVSNERIVANDSGTSLPAGVLMGNVTVYVSEMADSNLPKTAEMILSDRKRRSAPLFVKDVVPVKTESVATSEGNVAPSSEKEKTESSVVPLSHISGNCDLRGSNSNRTQSTGNISGSNENATTGMPSLTQKQTKKTLRSTTGKTKSYSYAPALPAAPAVSVAAAKPKKTKSKPKSIKKKEVPGVILEEIKLNYCTALGLIYAGVLPKPPLWDYHRLEHGRRRDNEEENQTPLSDVPHKKIKVAAVYEGDVMISAAKEIDTFDLSGL